MRNRPHIALSDADRAIVARWSTRTIGIAAALIAAVLVSPVLKGHADNGGSSRPAQSAPNPICASLDRRASSVIAELAQRHPVDVAEIST